MIKMSRGKNISSVFDIIERPVYKEILLLLRDENRAMSATEIRDSLFPERTVRNVYVYLSKLKKFQLIKQSRADKVRKSTVYEIISYTEIKELCNNRIKEHFYKQKNNLLVNLDSINRDLISWKPWAAQDFDSLNKQHIIFPPSAGKEKNSYFVDIERFSKFLQEYGLEESTITPVESASNEDYVNPLYPFIYDESADKVRLNWFGFTFPVEKEESPFIDEFLEYKLNPIKEELKNFFMLMCLDSEIKIIVKYGNMVAIDI